MSYFLRLLRKSYNALTNYGPRELLRRLFIFFDRKFRKDKYFHTFSSSRQTDQPTSRRALFITGEPKNATSYYRCEIPAAQLESQGWSVEIVYEDFSFQLPASSFDVIVFYRTPYSKVKKLFHESRDLGLVTIFSIDDFVYRRDLLEKLDVTKNLDEADRNRLLNRADGMVKLMKQCDAGIASTEYLAEDMRKYINGEVFVNRNGYLGETARWQADKPTGRQADKPTSRQADKLILGYFSGSETHDRDLALIWPVLMRILSENENVELWLGGRVQLPNDSMVQWYNEDKATSYACPTKLKERSREIRNTDGASSFFHPSKPVGRSGEIPSSSEAQRAKEEDSFDYDRIKDRVIKLPFMGRKKFIQKLAQVDINLLPLEDTEFNRGKSEIKFIEAALVGVPTVASPVGDLVKLLSGSKIGLLASSSEEWKERLDLLIKDLSDVALAKSDEEARRKIGHEAREYVLENYNQEKLGKKFAGFLETISTKF